MSNLFLGIDTSNYTSSFCLVDEQGKKQMEIKKPLTVKEGRLGLRQQEAVFQHVRNMETVATQLNGISGVIRGVSSSVSPRKVEGSYMPVFVVSRMLGKLIAGLLHVTYTETSHQRGHIRAGMEDLDPIGDSFTAFHLSGGTTEALRVDVLAETGAFNEKMVFESSDISIGQLIDRIGVYLGKPFPSGPALEAMLPKERGREAFDKRHYKAFFREGQLNLSGLETYLKKQLDQKEDPQKVVFLLFENIIQLLEKMIDEITEQKEEDVLFTGGVSSNEYIRSRLSELYKNKKANLYFCKKENCTD
ncbi:MAG TPA: O-sialoglycoprotein endopeptidase, partial [Eubacteriaceae bacterium]|nr:O-sialoglycoprotein endopeptidase [Eubacteriaceae bacterium]